MTKGKVNKEMTKKVPQKTRAEYEVWPVVFSICKEHKALFVDYEYARLSDIEEHCILCHPVENDSLGG